MFRGPLKSHKASLAIAVLSKSRVDYFFLLMTTFCVSAHKLYDLIVIELASFRSVWKQAKPVLWSPTNPAKGKPQSAVYLLGFPWLDSFGSVDLGGHRYIDHKNSPCRVYSVVVLFCFLIFLLLTSHLELSLSWSEAHLIFFFPFSLSPCLSLSLYKVFNFNRLHSKSTPVTTSTHISVCAYVPYLATNV